MTSEKWRKLTRLIDARVKAERNYGISYVIGYGCYNGVLTGGEEIRGDINSLNKYARKCEDTLNDLNQFIETEIE